MVLVRVGLEQAGFAQGEVRADADDQMVEHWNADDVAGLREAAGQCDVIGARRGIAGGMVVGDDHGRRIREQCGLEHLAGMHDGRIQCSTRQFMVRGHVPAAGQK